MLLQGGLEEVLNSTVSHADEEHGDALLVVGEASWGSEVDRLVRVGLVDATVYAGARQ